MGSEMCIRDREEKRVTVSRAKYSVEYPANFTLVAAMNPCLCGYYNHPAKECVCSPGAVHRYMSRISGPLMDRIDLHVEVTPVPAAELSAAAPGEPSAAAERMVSVYPNPFHTVTKITVGIAHVVLESMFGIVIPIFPSRCGSIP